MIDICTALPISIIILYICPYPPAGWQCCLATTLLCLTMFLFYHPHAPVARFMSDTEAWMELTDLYISEQDFAKAAYCMEELLLHNPHHHLYFQKYADIKYTQVSRTARDSRSKPRYTADTAAGETPRSEWGRCWAADPSWRCDHLALALLMY